MIVSSVPREKVEAVYPHVYKMIEKALKVSGELFDVASIFRALLEQKAGLWIMIDEDRDKICGAAVTRVVDYPNKRALSIDFIGGERMKEWLPILSAKMDAYAKSNDCSFIEGMGRKGWVKALAPYGYKPGVPTYRKDLTDEQGK